MRIHREMRNHAVAAKHFVGLLVPLPVELFLVGLPFGIIP